MEKRAGIGLGIILVIGVTLLFAALQLGFGSQTGEQPGRILPGVAVDGSDLGGLTLEQAEQVLHKKAQQLLDKELTLTLADKQWNYSYRELGVSIPAAVMARQALNYGQTGSVWTRLGERRRLRREGISLPLTWQWKRSELITAVAALAAEVEYPPADAQLVFRGDEVSLIPSKTGRRLDAVRTAEDMTRIIPLKGDGYVPLTTNPVLPELSTRMMRNRGVSAMIAKYTTRFNAANKPRVANIKAAAANLDGAEIAPGETFSFNETVGPRTEQRGFQEALIIENNDFVPGLGGGVCQVSSTLYNALLQADLPVTERRRHSLAVTYVPLGLDATVAFDLVDLKFENNTGRYVIIKAAVAEDSITIRLFGSPKPGQVMLRSIIEKKYPFRVIRKKDPGIPRGKTFVEQNGQPGYLVRVEKTVVRDGEVIASEVISRDRYPGQDKILREGTGSVEN